MSWQAPFEDGHKPCISPDGRYVAAGLGTGSVLDRLTGRIVTLPGRAFISGWLTPAVLAFRSDTQMFRAAAPNFAPTPLDTFRGPANWHSARSGVWAVGANGGGRGWLQVNGVEVLSGPEVRGADVEAGGSVITSNGDWEIRRWHPDGHLDTFRPAIPPTTIRTGLAGMVAYGYSGPSYVLDGSRNVEVTVTPNRKEGVACIFSHQGRTWLATPNDEGEFAGVFLRPYGEQDVVWVRTPAVWADVVSLGDQVVLASCTATGRLTVETVNLNVPRQRLQGKPAPPPPTPEPPPPVEPPPVSFIPRRLPDPVRSTVEQYAAKFPLPTTEPEQREGWMAGLVATVVARHGSQYGWKRGDPGRPLSLDCLAYKDANIFEGWDLVTSAGSPAAALNPNAISIDLTGQTFVPVAGKDHLNSNPPEPPPPPPPGPPGPPTPVVCPSEAKIAALEAEVKRLNEEVELLKAAWNLPLTVEGRTERAGGIFGHSHQMNLVVKRG